MAGVFIEQQEALVAAEGGRGERLGGRPNVQGLVCFSPKRQEEPGQDFEQKNDLP